MPPAWPDDAYLLLLGQVIYSASEIEGTLLFDLPRMPAPPPRASSSRLMGKTTTQLGDELTFIARQVQDPAWRDYLARGGTALAEIARLRNSLLHGRPAIDGARLAPGGHSSETADVSTEYLEELLARLEEHRTTLSGLRPPDATSGG